MPYSSYIGREPQYGALEKQVITGDNSTTSFALNFNVGDPNMLLVVSIGAVLVPGTAYTVDSAGANITFSAAPSSSHTHHIIFLGQQLSSTSITVSSETVSGDGSGTDAVNKDRLVTFLNTSGGTSALTLATGSFAGQMKIITMNTAGNAATMTASNGNLNTTAVSTSIVWDAVGESVTLIYDGSKWIPISSIGATIS